MKVLEEITSMVERKKLGFLGREMVHSAWLYAVCENYKDDATPDEVSQMLEKMRGKIIKLNIFPYRSELMERAIDVLQPNFRKGNFHFALNVEGIDWNTPGGNYPYNGSAEVFDCEIRRDIQRLGELGFVFEYMGIRE